MRTSEIIYRAVVGFMFTAGAFGLLFAGELWLAGGFGIIALINAASVAIWGRS